MVEEGVLKNPDVDAIFGLHIGAQQPVGTIAYKSGGIMAAVNSFEINVSGKQSHGSTPWASVDPIMASVKIIDGLQTLVSREMPLTTHTRCRHAKANSYTYERNGTCHCKSLSCRSYY